MFKQYSRQNCDLVENIQNEKKKYEIFKLNIFTYVTQISYSSSPFREIYILVWKLFDTDSI